jgi:hypothetical protein
VIALELPSKQSGNGAGLEGRFGEMLKGYITDQFDPSMLLTKSELQVRWWELFKAEPPAAMRKELMLRMVAYRLQEQEFGELSEPTRRRLRELAAAIEANPNAVVSSRPSTKPGTRLVRQWKQHVHVVEIKEKGYQYKGVRYKSLSEIARLITGTRWSGPLFFGLNAQTKNELKEG